MAVVSRTEEIGIVGKLGDVVPPEDVLDRASGIGVKALGIGVPVGDTNDVVADFGGLPFRNEVEFDSGEGAIKASTESSKFFKSLWSKDLLVREVVGGGANEDIVK